MDIRKIYTYALQREQEGKRFFEQNAERLSHAAATGAFKRLAAEEQKHIDASGMTSEMMLDAIKDGSISDERKMALALTLAIKNGFKGKTFGDVQLAKGALKVLGISCGNCFY